MALLLALFQMLSTVAFPMTCKETFLEADFFVEGREVEIPLSDIFAFDLNDVVFRATVPVPGVLRRLSMPAYFEGPETSKNSKRFMSIRYSDFNEIPTHVAQGYLFMFDGMWSLAITNLKEIKEDTDPMFFESSVVYPNFTNLGPRHRQEEPGLQTNNVIEFASRH